MPSPTAAAVPTIPAVWRVAQLAGVVATLALVVGLFTTPEPALSILWNVLIPLVPLSLLLSPLIWRNVCPLATLNLALARGRSRRLSPSAARRMIVIAIALFVTLVAARRFVFNTDATTLAVVIVAVAALALVLGAFFDQKAGFCNAICPVLPVERLYGQSPLLRVQNARCPTCTLCTAKGCIDLSPARSIGLSLGDRKGSPSWLRTGYGLFAASFPGFMLGYFTLEDVALGAAGSVYLHVALWMAGSYLVTAALVLAFRPVAEIAWAVLGAAAVGLYYWFSADTVATAFGLSAPWPVGLRLTTGSFVLVWLVVALRRTSRYGTRGAHISSKA